MADWDADSAALQSNLDTVLTAIVGGASLRSVPSVENARRWQRQTMRGLTVPRREYVGRFRGEVGLEGVEVEIAGVRGTPAVEVANELGIFERKLRAAVVVLDAQYPEADDLDDDASLSWQAGPHRPILGELHFRALRYPSCRQNPSATVTA